MISVDSLGHDRSSSPGAAQGTQAPVLSLVLPVFNEAEVVPELHKRLQEFLSVLELASDAVEVVFVDDGSRDASFALLRELCASEPRYRLLSFSRNFGHQAAITAGMDYARGRAVVVMDADLQDPPEVVLDMMVKWREGFDVVYAVRRNRRGESWFKVVSALLYYRLFASMIPIDVPLDAGDFRLMSRRVILAFRELRETHRFIRGMIAWVGFKQTQVVYDRPGRFAGTSKYPLRKMARFAIDGMTSFSIMPLRFSTYIATAMIFVSMAIAVWAVLAKFAFHHTVTGWTAIVVIVTLLASVQFFMIGILGEYVGRIFEEVKRRPLYIIRETANLPAAVDDSRADEAG
jgi:glycosyltransferase involved in cell wall biosynthesis